MKVLKFGGTSVGDSKMINKTAEIILNIKKESNVVIVVSAMTKVTNNLIDICDSILNGDEFKAINVYKLLKIRHIDTLLDIDNNINSTYYKKLLFELDNLESIIKGLILLKIITEQAKANILYYGEILSSIIMSASINKLGVSSNNYLSKELLICKGAYLNSECDFTKSEIIMQNWIKKINLDTEIPVLTGFGGGDEMGNSYLFDRGGSDYVATIIGNIFNANSVEIWTDVDGVMSADPRIVKNPIIWDELDYSVSAEFALTGAKVLHPKTISPAQEKNIPVYIKNTFNPKAKGTKICKSTKGFGIKGINIDNNQVLITFIDNSMLGGVGYLYSAIKIIRDNSVSIDSVATSETSFTLSIKENDLTKKLKDELCNLDNKFSITIDTEVTKISIVGDTVDDYSVLSTLDDIKLISKGEFNKTLTIFINKEEKDIILTKLHKSIFGI